MFVFMSVVVIVWGSVYCVAAVVKDSIFSLVVFEVPCILGYKSHFLTLK